MIEPIKDFETWQTEVLNHPESIAEHFHKKVMTLSGIERQSIFSDLVVEAKARQKFTRITDHSEKPLSGIPFLLQDLFDVEGVPTACGAPLKELLADPAEKSCALYLLLEKLGAIYLGKNPPSEFGYDASGSNPTFGTCRHPDSERYILGGGSGASATAVRHGYAPLAFGLDTLGGVRIPAAFQGLFAYRMEYCQLNREGVFPIAPSLDSVGFFTNTLADFKKTFLALHDMRSSALIEEASGCLILDISGAVSSDIKFGMRHLARELKCEEDLSVSTEVARSFKDGKTALDVITSREMYVTHRYWIEEYDASYDPNLLQAIENGMECSPAAAEAAEQTQQLIRMKLSEIFEKYDYIMLPISTEINPTSEEWTKELEDEILHLIAPASLASIPTLVLPFRCDGNRWSAAQLLINPRKVQTVLSILNTVRNYYEDWLVV